MTRYVTITLDKRGVSCTARLLDDAAPRTAAAVWDALPLSRAGLPRQVRPQRDLRAAARSSPTADPGKENTTITPIPGDVCWFTFEGDDLGNPAYGYEAEEEHRSMTRRSSTWRSSTAATTCSSTATRAGCPATCSARSSRGSPEMAAACQDVWMGGARGETLTFARDREE